MTTTALAMQVPDAGSVGAAVLVLLILSALVQCFFGYVLFRLLLVGLGLVAGSLLGAMLASLLRPEPTGLDYFVACFTCAVIGGMLAWFLYRLMFAIWVAAAVVWLLVVVALGQPGSAGAWVFAAVVGLAAGIYAFLYTRPVFIFLSALSGALAAVSAAAALMAGATRLLPQALPHLPTRPWAIGAWILAWLALTGAGIYVQTKLTRALRVVLMAPEKSVETQRRPRARRSGRSTAVRPRFARV